MTSDIGKVGHDGRLAVASDVASLEIRLRSFVRHRLPALNASVEVGEAAVADYLATVSPLLRDAVKVLTPSLTAVSRDDARRHIQLIGFLASSLERHFQAAQTEAGKGLETIPGLGRLLVALGAIARHPPRDSHYSYWLWNRDAAPLTFTGDAQEDLFNRAVNDTNHFHGDSCATLRPICAGDVDIASSDAADRLGLAASNTHSLFVTWGLFTARNEAGGVGMTPQFFATRMRTYLPTYPVVGTEWGGVNAAHEVTQMAVDWLIGTVEPFYAGVIEKRLRYLTDEDRASLARDMAMPSVVFRMVERLNLTQSDVAAADPVGLADAIARQGERFVASVAAYSKLFTEVGRLTSRHWALIINFLVKPMAQLTPEQFAKLPVKPNQGTGGASHGETERIMIMRKQHRASEKLRSALALLRAR
jgi:hypothetical protein